MRIRALDLRAFGHFTSQRLDLTRAPLTLVYGPNGGGKSTALTAIESALFGVEETTTFAFLHRPDQLRIGLELEDGAEGSFSLLRRKGRKATLAHPDGTPWTAQDDDRLHAMLRGMDRAVFAAMFGLSHRSLRAGAQELLRSQGELGQSLLGAETGVSLGQLSQAFAKAADDLWVPKGQRPPLNAALHRYRDARQAVVQGTIRPREWLEVEAAETELAAKRAEQESDRRKLQATQRELERLQAALPVLADLEGAEQAFQALPPAPVFSPAQLETWESTTASASSVVHDLETAEAVRAEKTSERDSISLEEPLLLRAAEIRAVEQGIAGYGQSRDDLPLRQRERETLAAGALARLQPYWPEWTLERVQEQLMLRPPERSALQRLADAPALRQADRVTIDADQRRLDRRTARWRATLKELGSSRDISALTTALETSQRDGAVERDLEDAARRRKRVQAVVTQALGRLHLAGRDPAAVAALVPPARESVIVFRDEWQTLDRESEALQEKRQAWVDKQTATKRDLRALELAGPVPSPTDLVAARAARETAWTRLKQEWATGSQIGTEAWVAYEQAVATADSLADQLWHEAERVTQRAQLQSDLETQETALTRLADRATEGQRRRTDWTERWARAWVPSGVEAPSQTDALAWLEAHAIVADRQPELAEATALVTDLSARRDRHVAALRSGLTTGGVTVPEGATLVELQDLAAHVRGEAGKAEQKQREAEAGLASQAEEEQALEERRGTLEADERAWQVDWAAALERLHLPAGTLPDSVHTSLQELEAALQDARSVGELDHRLRGIQRDMDQFATVVVALAEGVAPDLVSVPAPDEQARQLGDRLRAMETGLASRVALERDIAAQTKRIAALETTGKKAQATLTDLAQAVGLSEMSELETAVQLAKERDALTATIERYRQDLLGRGTGWTVEEFQRRRAGIDPDTLADTLTELDETATRQDADLQATVQAHTLASKRREDLSGGGATAALAAEDQQAAAAEVAQLAQRYARLQCAAALLRLTMERYREQHQARVLERAGELFRTLTDSEFTRLDVAEEHTGGPAIVAIHSDKGRPSPVEELSDGECDQLYMALRLASLEHHCAEIGPMPVILDDVFVYFDDDRTTAALRVLAELSRQTQVLIFTHHQHVLRLAEAALPDGTLAMQRVVAPAIATAERAGAPRG
ncbi:MAG: ATP-binding protein [Candidatus Dormibacteria bacterium]